MGSEHVEKTAKSAVPSDNFDTSPGGERETSLQIADLAERSGFENIQRLAVSLSTGDAVGALAARLQAISIEQLEMLEAELQNQNFLPPRLPNIDQSGGLISNSAAREMDAVRWFVRRKRPDKIPELTLLINLPEYLLKRASMLLSPVEMQLSHLATIPARNELHYIDRFAGFIIGMRGEAATRFQRGLNLVLQVVCREKVFKSGETRTAMRHRSNENGGTVATVIIPVERRSLLKLLS